MGGFTFRSDSSGRPCGSAATAHQSVGRLIVRHPPSATRRLSSAPPHGNCKRKSGQSRQRASNSNLQLVAHGLAYFERSTWTRQRLGKRACGWCRRSHGRWLSMNQSGHVQPAAALLSAAMAAPPGVSPLRAARVIVRQVANDQQPIDTLNLLLSGVVGAHRLRHGGSDRCGLPRHLCRGHAIDAECRLPHSRGTRSPVLRPAAEVKPGRQAGSSR